jgi:hypothetical protein
MSAGRGLVRDANILIRAALGRRVRALLETYEDSIAFYTPDVCFEDAREYLPGVLASRGGDPQAGLILALMLQIPVWTEDQDFFGSGLATWTTDRVELYLRGSHA